MWLKSKEEAKVYLRMGFHGGSMVMLSLNTISIEGVRGLTRKFWFGSKNVGGKLIQRR